MKSTAWRLVCGVVLCGQIALAAQTLSFTTLGQWHPDDAVGVLRSVSVNGHTVFVLKESSTIHLIDCGDPRNPSSMGTYTIPGGYSQVGDMCTISNHVLITVENDGGANPRLEVIDVHNPQNPARTSVVEGHYGSLHVQGDRLYASSFLSNGCGFDIFDITDTGNPVRIGRYAGGNGAWGMAVSDGVAWYFAWDTVQVSSNSFSDIPCLRAIDVSAPANNVSILRTYDLNALLPDFHIGKVGLAGQALFLMPEYNRDGYHEAVWFLNVDRVEEVSVLSGFNHVRASTAWDYSVTDNYLFIALQCGGLQVVDINDLRYPKEAAYIQGRWYEDVEVVGNRAYVIVREAADDSLGGWTSWLEIQQITELPAITRQTITGSLLNLQWNEPAKGMKLQRATSLTDPDWQDLLGSENTNAVSLPLWGGSEFFRLVKPRI